MACEVAQSVPASGVLSASVQWRQAALLVELVLVVVEPLEVVEPPVPLDPPNPHAAGFGQAEP
jgi:hypothetical protein